MPGLRWFKVAADLMRHKKSVALAGRLHDPRAWAYVVQMWAWFCEQAGHGEQIGPDAPYLIAQGSGWLGDPDEFCRHLVAVGFLETVPEGFRVHNWEKWAGAHVEYQRKDAARKREDRRTSGQSEPCPQDILGTSRGQKVGRPSERPQECLSTLSSVSVASEGGAGGNERRADGTFPSTERLSPLPRKRAPGLPAEWPQTAAVLGVLWERGWSDAEWPKSRGAAKQVESAIGAVGITVAVERLLSMRTARQAQGEEPKPWLGWHLDAIQPKAERQRAPQGVSAPQEFTKTLEEVAQEREAARGRAQ